MWELGLVCMKGEGGGVYEVSDGELDTKVTNDRQIRGLPCAIDRCT